MGTEEILGLGEIKLLLLVAVRKMEPRDDLEAMLVAAISSSSSSSASIVKPSLVVLTAGLVNRNTVIRFADKSVREIIIWFTFALHQ